MPLRISSGQPSRPIAFAFRVTVAAALVATVAGCGGGSSATSSTTTTAPAITKADFTARANSICQVMNDKVRSVPDPGSDPDKAADALQLQIAATSDAAKQIRALPLPAADETTLNDIYAKIDKVLSDGAELVAALRARDRTQALAAQDKLKADTTAANDASNAYGLTVCGS